MLPFHRRVKFTDVYQGSDLSLAETLLNSNSHKRCLLWHSSIPGQPTPPFGHIWSPSGLKCYINTRMVYGVRRQPGLCSGELYRWVQGLPHSQAMLSSGTERSAPIIAAGWGCHTGAPIHSSCLHSRQTHPEVQSSYRSFWL